jgi:hypothetical protein
MSEEEKSEAKETEVNNPEPETEAVASKPKKQDLPVWVVIPILLIAIAIIGYFGYQFAFGPPPMSPEARAKRDFLQSLARKSGGDMSKLSKEDIDKANSATFGHAAQVIKDMAHGGGNP